MWSCPVQTGHYTNVNTNSDVWDSLQITSVRWRGLDWHVCLLLWQLVIFIPFEAVFLERIIHIFTLTQLKHIRGSTKQPVCLLSYPPYWNITQSKLLWSLPILWTLQMASSSKIKLFLPALSIFWWTMKVCFLFRN